MAVGLFGKLPSRRDFVEFAVDRAVMAEWDPWLQRAVAASREFLGEGWLDIYLQAPIWRFWLGPGICGMPVLGALMPSVDGVGRYFPLSLVWTGEEGRLPPPEHDEQAEWFTAAEEILLGALAEDVGYEGVKAALALLPPVRCNLGVDEGGQSVPALFRALRAAAEPDFYRGTSCWWVPSPDGGATPPRAMLRRGLPDPSDYATMLSGQEHDRVAATVGEG